MVAYGDGRACRSPASVAPVGHHGRSWWLGGLLITIVLILVNAPLILGIGVGIWDVDDAYLARYVFWADAIRAGRLVLWDPWTNAGMAAYASPGMGTFSPLNLLLAAIGGGTSRGFVLLWMTYWWIGGIGILQLARHLGAPAWGGTVVALGLICSGVYTGHAAHTPVVIAFSLVPWIVWRLDEALLSRSWVATAQAGALWGLSGLSGYPAIVIMTAMLIAAWSLGRWLCGSAGWRDHEPASVGWAGAWPGVPQVIPGARVWPPATWVLRTSLVIVVVGVAVLAPSYTGFFFEDVGTRGEPLARSWALLENAFHPGALVTLASPGLVLLKFANPGLWAYTDLTSINVYAGSAVAFLALTALLAGPQDRWRWWLVFLAACSMGLALSAVLPLRGWLYDVFYPTRFFRQSAMFRIYVVFGLCVLAIDATRDLADRSAWPRVARALCGAIGVSALGAAVAISSTIWRVDGAMDVFAGLPLAHAVAAWGGALGVAWLAWLRRTNGRGVAVALVMLAIVEGVMAGFVSAKTVYNTESWAIERWRALDAAHVPSLDLLASGFARVPQPCPAGTPCQKNDQLITKRPVLDAYVESESRFQPASVAQPLLAGMALGSHRAWFSRSAWHVAPTTGCFERFVAHVARLERVPLVITPYEQMTDQHGPDPDSPGCEVSLVEAPALQPLNGARIVRYDPEHLVLEIDAPADGWLLVMDRWSRSWRATVDGQPVAIAAGNFLYRAVPVPAGASRIAFTFAVEWLAPLLALSWGTLAMVALVSAVDWWGRGRRRT